MTTSDKVRTSADIRYHFLWYTRLKADILSKDIKTKLKSVLSDICEDNGLIILGGATRKNHVHIILSCPPSIAPSKIAQLLKGGSARSLKQTFPNLNNAPYDESIWERGYFCLSFGDGDEEMKINKYIEDAKNEIEFRV